MFILTIYKFKTFINVYILIQMFRWRFSDIMPLDTILSNWEFIGVLGFLSRFATFRPPANKVTFRYVDNVFSKSCTSIFGSLVGDIIFLVVQSMHFWQFINSHDTAKMWKIFKRNFASVFVCVQYAR